MGTSCSIHVMDTSLQLLVQSPQPVKKFKMTDFNVIQNSMKKNLQLQNPTCM